MKDLMNLCWKRYRLFIGAVCILILGVQLYSARTFVNEWDLSYQWLNSSQFVDDIAWQMADVPEDAPLRFFQMQDEASSFERQFGDEVSLANIRTFRLSLRKDAPEWNLTGFTELFPQGSNGVTTQGTSFGTYGVFIIFGTMLVGFLFFYLDTRTRFIQFLFSSRFKRLDILQAKILLLFAPLSLAFIISQIIKYLIIFNRIPSPYMNIGFSDVLPSLIFNTLYLVALLSFGAFFGVIMGQVATGIFSMIGFALFIIYGMGGASQLYFILNRPFENNRTFSLLNGIVVNYLDVAIGNGLPVSYITVILISLVFLGIVFYAYPKLSLENTGEYLLLPQLRRLTLALTIVGSTFIGWTVPMQEARWEANGRWVELSVAESLTSSLRTAIIAPILMGLLIYFFIYGKKGLQKIQNLRIKKTNI